MGRRRYDPVGFGVDEETGAIDVAGHRNPTTQKWRNVLRDGRVSLVIDDVLPPWQPRAIEVRGRAEVLCPTRRATASCPALRPA